jgi:hypothetical protein
MSDKPRWKETLRRGRYGVKYIFTKRPYDFDGCRDIRVKIVYQNPSPEQLAKARRHFALA